MRQSNKFISPGAWFSMEYPISWNEFEDSPSCFLFFDPNKWEGNFRISAFKNESSNYGKECVENEIRQNNAEYIKIGQYTTAYSCETFEEDDKVFENHFWVVDGGTIVYECSFTNAQGGGNKAALNIIFSLTMRDENKKYPAEYIPVRLSEIDEINDSYEYVAECVKELLKKDFTGVESDILNLQKIVEMNAFGPKKKKFWLALGIALCVILSNEIEGFEWLTLIDGNREAPILHFKASNTKIDPLHLIWSKVKRKEDFDVSNIYKQIIETLA